MPLTLVEKILAQHAGRDVVAVGERVRVSPKVVALDEDAVVLSKLDALAPGAVVDGRRIVVFEEGFRADVDGRWRALDRAARAFAREVGATFVAAGRGGAQVVELADRGLVGPGDLVVSSARGARVLGVLGAFVLEPNVVALEGLVRDPAFDVEVPRTVRVTLHGKPGRWSSGRDLGERAIAVAGEACVDAVVQLEGVAYAELELPERMALADAFVAVGARGIVCVPDERALAWTRARCARLVRPIVQDHGAVLSRSIDVDVDGVDPVVRSCAPEVAPKPVANLPTLALSGVVLGGEHGGRIDDLRLAARLLKEHPIADELTLIIVPGSQRALQHAAEEGLLTVLVRAGALIAQPSAGLFSGPRGFVGAPGDRWLFTTRPVGVPDGVHALLSGSAVAIASAVLGRIGHPDEVLRRLRETV
ncbi:MAG: hypothetical protein IT459_15505 [Planctomycetes bacterium]|nr:hypothetical protein [Planctomycetota bacterium]